MSKLKSYIGIRNDASSSTLELEFTDYIYDGFDWNTWETINLVQSTIDKIKAAKPTTIKMVINSMGGDVAIGLALYNYIKGYGATVEVDVIGFAASIASVMAMAASPGKLKMAKASYLILHAAWQYAAGNASDLRKTAEELDKVTNTLAGIYADRSGQKASFFTDMWQDGDVWVSAEDAINMKLADETYNGQAIAAQYKGKIVNTVLNPNEYPFKNIPAALKNSEGEDTKSLLQNLNANFMTFTETIKNLFKTEKPAAEVVKPEAAKPEAEKPAAEAEKPKAEEKPAASVTKAEVEEIVSGSMVKFADAMVAMFPGLKPAAEAAKPAAEKPKAEEKPNAEKPGDDDEEEGAGEGEGDPKAELDKLKVENKKLKDKLAANTSKPKKDAAGGKVSAAKVEYESE